MNLQITIIKLLLYIAMKDDPKLMGEAAKLGDDAMQEGFNAIRSCSGSWIKTGRLRHGAKSGKLPPKTYRLLPPQSARWWPRSPTARIAVPRWLLNPMRKTESPDIFCGANAEPSIRSFAGTAKRIADRRIGKTRR